MKLTAGGATGASGTRLASAAPSVAGVKSSRSGSENATTPRLPLVVGCVMEMSGKTGLSPVTMTTVQVADYCVGVQPQS